MPTLQSHLDAVVAALAVVAPTDLVWPAGLMNPGGPHRRLKGMISPISIGDDECLVFGRIIEGLRPAHVFVIGNAFGFSAAYIGRVMEEHGGVSLVTLDSQSEGDGAKCAQVAQRLADQLGLRLLVSKKGSSPEDVPTAVAAAVHDLVFIDGMHVSPYVTNDLNATLPYANERTVFVWHDYWTNGVSDGVTVARRKGFRCLFLPTSCEMVIGARDPDVFASLQRLFPDANETPFPHGRFDETKVVTATLVNFLWRKLRRG